MVERGGRTRRKPSYWLDYRVDRGHLNFYNLCFPQWLASDEMENLWQYPWFSDYQDNLVSTSGTMRRSNLVLPKGAAWLPQSCFAQGIGVHWEFEETEKSLSKEEPFRKLTWNFTEWISCSPSKFIFFFYVSQQ